MSGPVLKKAKDSPSNERARSVPGADERALDSTGRGIRLFEQLAEAGAEIRISATMAGKVVSDGTRHQWGQQYRRLAAALHQTRIRQGSKVVMITSGFPGEGKTLTTVNLAMTLSKAYRHRVLMIDADVRKPSLHEVFQVPNARGQRYGPDEGKESEVVLVQLTSSLWLLPAGPAEPDDVGITDREHLAQILREVSTRFDWILIDTPPTAVAPEASLLADVVDGVVFVVSAAQSPFGAVQRAVESIDPDKILGVVLNRADERSASYGYGYGYSDSDVPQ